MIIHMPDPDPGRCLNYRNGTMGQGGLGNARRCLDYEGHSGACRFAPEVPATVFAQSQQTSSYQGTPKPEPWVSPLDANRG